MAFPKRRESCAVPFDQIIEFEDLWSQRKIPVPESALNFTSIETGHCTPHSFPVASPAESVTITVGKITVIVGLQSGNSCQPLFVGKSSMKLFAQDWNTSLVFNSKCMFAVTDKSNLQTKKFR